MLRDGSLVVEIAKILEVGDRAIGRCPVRRGCGCDCVTPRTDHHCFLLRSHELSPVLLWGVPVFAAGPQCPDIWGGSHRAVE